MSQRLDCKTIFEVGRELCSSYRHTPEMVGGFRVYILQALAKNKGSNPSRFSKMGDSFKRLRNNG